jgi:hypothetical protein
VGERVKTGPYDPNEDKNKTEDTEEDKEDG